MLWLGCVLPVWPQRGTQEGRARGPPVHVCVHSYSMMRWRMSQSFPEGSRPPCAHVGNFGIGLPSPPPPSNRDGVGGWVDACASACVLVDAEDGQGRAEKEPPSKRSEKKCRCVVAVHGHVAFVRRRIIIHLITHTHAC